MITEDYQWVNRSFNKAGNIEIHAGAFVLATVHVRRDEYGQCTDKDITEAEDNARAITAVNPLLEACKQALMWIERDETAHNRLYGTGNALRAAIEAATGVRQVPPVDPPDDVCEKCGEHLSGHEDESATHCRWCVTCTDTTGDEAIQSTGEER